jgi:hypothetical protein
MQIRDWYFLPCQQRRLLFYVARPEDIHCLQHASAGLAQLLHQCHQKQRVPARIEETGVILDFVNAD